jgi:hypothetical protein
MRFKIILIKFYFSFQEKKKETVIKTKESDYKRFQVLELAKRRYKTSMFNMLT